MPRVVRLETVADLQDAPNERDISVSARHEAVLDDGRRVILLDDRGWTSSLRGPGAKDVANVWETMSEREIVETARMVVGPDEPYDGRSYADMEAGHWSTLADKLRAEGVDADPSDLRRLPHDVVLSDRLRERLGRTA
jgi:hypothetical protein